METPCNPLALWERQDNPLETMKNAQKPPYQAPPRPGSPEHEALEEIRAQAHARTERALTENPVPRRREPHMLAWHGGRLLGLILLGAGLFFACGLLAYAARFCVQAWRAV